MRRVAGASPSGGTRRAESDVTPGEGGAGVGCGGGAHVVGVEAAARPEPRLTRGAAGSRQNETRKED